MPRLPFRRRCGTACELLVVGRRAREVTRGKVDDLIGCRRRNATVCHALHEGIDRAIGPGQRVGAEATDEGVAATCPVIGSSGIGLGAADRGCALSESLISLRRRT